ncbi:MAG TPA: IS1380 family transposase [Isosphaeraceae bacterium]|nr:IS1380 family transposase [Isosphaeraceae bacterium]
MGDCPTEPLRPQFDRRPRLRFFGAKVSSDAGLLAYRELDDALDLTRTAAAELQDTRTGRNSRHSLTALLRQSIFSRLAGYEDLNDAERLRYDPAMRAVVGGRARDHTAASTSEVARFETETLSSQTNLKGLMDLSGRWIDRAHQRRKLTRLVLDMDSSVSETYGRQEGSAYNGHCGCTCYHPLFVFNQFGDLERVMLRRGNRHSAKFWRRVLLPVIARYRDLKVPKFFRGDAAFASPKLFRVLEQESYWYAIRLKANAVLERHIAHLLKRPVGRPSKKPKVFYHSFRYRAKSWDRARRVVAKVEWHAGELFPRVGFVVTNLKRSPKRVIKFYNGRGTAEQWIKEGKNAIKWTRLSCRRFKDNQVRLQLFALAYNLGNFLRQLALPCEVKHWSLTTLVEKLIKIGAKVVSRSKTLTFQMAEVAVPRTLFAAILDRIDRLRLVPGTG